MSLKRSALPSASEPRRTASESGTVDRSCAESSAVRAARWATSSDTMRLSAIRYGHRLLVGEPDGRTCLSRSTRVLGGGSIEETRGAWRRWKRKRRQLLTQPSAPRPVASEAPGKSLCRSPLYGLSANCLTVSQRPLDHRTSRSRGQVGDIAVANPTEPRRVSRGRDRSPLLSVRSAWLPVLLRLPIRLREPCCLSTYIVNDCARLSIGADGNL
jgi:hypothetical protein